MTQIIKVFQKYASANQTKPINSDGKFIVEMKTFRTLFFLNVMGVIYTEKMSLNGK